MDLHLFFLPMVAMGHLIPMLHLARLFAGRRGVRATVVAPSTAISLIQPTLHHPIQLLPLGELALITHPQNNSITPEMAAEIDRLEVPFLQLLRDHSADCIVADLLYPWASSVAEELGIPSVLFSGIGCFSSVILKTLGQLAIPDHDDRRPFLLPGLPDEIHLARPQLPDFVTHPSDFVKRALANGEKRYGMIVNTFDDLERDYIAHAKKSDGGRIWCVGPLSLSQPKEASFNFSDELMQWLDSKKHTNSVLYLCFGTLGLLVAAQLREIALGLQASGVEFVWVVRDAGDSAEWLPEGFDVGVIGAGKGMIVKDWVPQPSILNHPAVGGFVTHCGWNSCVEAVAAGVPMVTWPLHSEQFFNELLVVDLLGIGVPAGATVCSIRAEERNLVSAESIRNAVAEVMGSGDEAAARRKRAARLREASAKATEEGGTSNSDMDHLLNDLINLKVNRLIAH
ncbi:UDP-glucose flavonoid 3-O-glucosyltransferase 7-like [Zingiber officinale]|uniref:Glycosyltransferase n=1 Tax=Zingiber officinale TaxID=94328 RepID=A0A8J5GJE0_ZINOF|nr:UDP-glucose flavonoid 3-O-glucosyltransferase 7-like [Zingiber officinale]KAG6504697.1 hypothetical protein ZIOFF_037033 [Zingiber officinale]